MSRVGLLSGRVAGLCIPRCRYSTAQTVCHIPACHSTAFNKAEKGHSMRLRHKDYTHLLFRFTRAF